MKIAELNREYWLSWNKNHIKECFEGDSVLPHSIVTLPIWWGVICFLGLDEIGVGYRVGIILISILPILFNILSIGLHGVEVTKMECLCPMSPQERKKHAQEKYLVVVFYRFLAFLVMDVGIGLLMHANPVFFIPALYHQLVASLIVRGKTESGKNGWSHIVEYIAIVISVLTTMMTTDAVYEYFMAILLTVGATCFYIPALIASAKKFREFDYFEEV